MALEAFREGLSTEVFMATQTGVGLGHLDGQSRVRQVYEMERSVWTKMWTKGK